MTEQERTRGRRVRADGRGRAVLAYIEDERDGRPWARQVETAGTDPAGLVLELLPGWIVSGTVELGEGLVKRGGRLMRHAHTMRRDLVADPPHPGWAGSAPGPGTRITACDRRAEEIFPAWRAAFPPGHPDHHSCGDEEALTGKLAPLLAGRVLGPLLPCSALAVDARDRVVAGVLVNDNGGLPWVGELFRRPGPAHAGLGALLLRRALARAAADGLAALHLVVSDGNPARRLYDHLGFRPIRTSMTVAVPEDSSGGRAPAAAP
ncbi:GNAT superfamily N-acetyltransferase [Spinactinospora alkalitolerans]|uniref:GNAT superfamily N-acetyltransferase n=1 Tax=Spinactinospora alkalitolerans TaxID=687207 RepID=A0A852TRN1_9ACTN|nr:GNAT family N-acetyltransferase [Spinactinospora alkalitolerans]NYE46669.1 GNAT superfamily N-acetyltransferase [Spinactinospora alkalitolerans]